MWTFTKGSVIVLHGFRRALDKPFPTKFKVSPKPGIESPFAPFEIEIPCTKNKDHYLKHDLNMVIDTGTMPFVLSPIAANVDSTHVDYQVIFDKIDADNRELTF